MASYPLLSRLWRWTSIVLRSTLYLITLGIALLFLASAYSPYVSPSRMTTAALLGLVFPITAFALGGITLYWTLRLRWRVLIFLGLVWLLGSPAVLRYIPLNWRDTTPERLEEDRTNLLKVMSYNVAAFGVQKHTRQRPNEILQYIKMTDADIVCLQEAITSDTSWGVISEADLRQFFKAQYPYIHIGLAQKNTGSALVLLSKYPIAKTRHLPLPSRSNGGMGYVLDVRGRKLRVMNLHLESFHLRQKDGNEYIALARQGDAFGLKDALKAKLGPVFRRRSKQVDNLKKVIAKINQDDLIICGDFNDTPISYTLWQLSDGLQDTYVESGRGVGYSFSSGIFIVRIDHILAGKSFVPEYSLVDRSITTSDHYPIISYLRWRE